ncbi:glutathione S-transferase U9-like [Syzygium oleosum]|uniref:glutathione S-transferase U9-like n=1 Tax=Syzygium oleosum TaxID=219896 RepID=UPI0011D1F3C9|nr:glutathione S-transferase U9-like [Syzygium oleosum]
MGESSEVVLLGTFGSSYCKRVELALKLKGIPYAYVEEDLTNKSDLLLRSNPVHRKVPVLLHNGHPICESLLILEYIDEYWSHAPKLLPEDPYTRSQIRFWADFYDQKVRLASYLVLKTKGKDQDKAREDLAEVLRVFEEGIQRDFPTKSPFFNGENLSFLGVVIGTNACHYQAFEEAIGKITDPQRNELFFSWVDELKAHPLMRENLPPHDKLVAKMKAKFFQTPKVAV